MLVQYAQPKGEFAGTIVDVKVDRDEGPGDELTWSVLFDNGDEGQLSELEVLNGRLAWDQKQELNKLKESIGNAALEYH